MLHPVRATNVIPTFAGMTRWVARFATAITELHE